MNRLNAKQRHRINLLKYLGNWENDFPNRTDYLDILKIKRTTLYKHFSPTELQEIENEGLELRKKNTARQRAKVFQSLLAEAKSGNIRAIKEFLDRTEGKVVDKHEYAGKDGASLFTDIQIEVVPSDGRDMEENPCRSGK